MSDISSEPLTVVEGCESLPQLFRKRCTELGDRLAMREKEFVFGTALAGMIIISAREKSVQP